jgi:hypothetical protein
MNQGNDVVQQTKMKVGRSELQCQARGMQQREDAIEVTEANQSSQRRKGTTAQGRRKGGQAPRGAARKGRANRTARRFGKIRPIDLLQRRAEL